MCSHFRFALFQLVINLAIYLFLFSPFNNSQQLFHRLRLVNCFRSADFIYFRSSRTVRVHMSVQTHCMLIVLVIFQLKQVLFLFIVQRSDFMICCCSMNFMVRYRTIERLDLKAHLKTATSSVWPQKLSAQKNRPQKRIEFLEIPLS